WKITYKCLYVRKRSIRHFIGLTCPGQCGQNIVRDISINGNAFNISSYDSSNLKQNLSHLCDNILVASCITSAVSAICSGGGSKLSISFGLTYWELPRNASIIALYDKPPYDDGDI
ncbi:hypothetical protein DERP_004065, partial [Dermatophagoides pteronyssinus]